MVLVINCGSSSLKFAVMDMAAQRPVLVGLAEKLGLDDAFITFKQGDERTSFPLLHPDHGAAMQAMTDHLRQCGLMESIAAVGHRVVHGGEVFKASALIDEAVLEEIEKCVHLAPLHNPAHLIGIHHALEYFHGLPQVAAFDTAFHQTMPEHAYLYAVPMELYRQHGVRRYGFHGSSYRYALREAARIFAKPEAELALVCAHLGNGASVAAIRAGQSVDTSMGLTPLEGLVMGTRSGDVDPGLFNHLADEMGMSALQTTAMLNKQSGLLGLSGLSSDCRELEQAAAGGHEGAKRALEKFCYQLAKHLAGQLVAAGAIDALIFTGGIGENSAWVRARSIEWLAPLGFALDATANQDCTRGRSGFIHASGSQPVLVINANEELMIALDTAQLAGLAQTCTQPATPD
jgi:acetate kinase